MTLPIRPFEYEYRFTEYEYEYEKNQRHPFSATKIPDEPTKGMHRRGHLPNRSALRLASGSIFKSPRTQSNSSGLMARARARTRTRKAWIDSSRSPFQGTWNLSIGAVYR
jgi:hypothetical protein